MIEAEVVGPGQPEAASEITDHDIRVDLAEPIQEIKQPDQSRADLDGAVRTGADQHRPHP